MAIKLSSTYNIDTKELISREVEGEADRNPTPEFVNILYQRWLEEHQDEDTADA